jgi:hypothetical protein
MKYLLIALQHPRYIQRAIELAQTYAKKSTDELVSQYNSSCKLGIVGSAQQALMLGAIRAEMIRRLGQSPIVLEGGAVLSLTSAVELREGALFYLDGHKVGNGKTD